MEDTIANQNAAAETAATPETPVTPEPTTPKRSLKKIIGAVILIAIIGVLGYVGYTRMRVESVAVVNGTKITKVELDKNIAMMTKSAALQGIDVTDINVINEIKSQALTNLVNNELLKGAAQKAGLSTNEAAVKSAYDSLVSEVGGEDALKTRMESVGLTPDTLMGNINDRLVVDQYIESQTNIKDLTVTDDEIKAYLASVQTDGVELPPLEEIRPQIEATLLAQKQQKIVDELIEKLREEGQVTIIGQ